jgi:hypothetical protein
MSSHTTPFRHRLAHLVIACALVSILFIAADSALALNGKIEDGGRYMEKLGICSFQPPQTWAPWDYYGLDVFSPDGNRDIRLSLVAEPADGDDPLPKAPGEDAGETGGDDPGNDTADLTSPFLKKKAKEWENTFSTPDYELISLEAREFEGYPGVEVSARATEENRLFPGAAVRIVRYYTPTHTITMTLRCPQILLDEYRDLIDAAVDSLTIGPPAAEGPSLP